jgi:hypothetical protein
MLKKVLYLLSGKQKKQLAILGLGLLKSLTGTLGIIILYGILQIKNDSNRSGWDCLK